MPTKEMCMHRRCTMQFSALLLTFDLFWPLSGGVLTTLPIFGRVLLLLTAFGNLFRLFGVFLYALVHFRPLFADLWPLFVAFGYFYQLLATTFLVLFDCV